MIGTRGGDGVELGREEVETGCECQSGREGFDPGRVHEGGGAGGGGRGWGWGGAGGRDGASV